MSETTLALTAFVVFYVMLGGISIGYLFLRLGWKKSNWLEKEMRAGAGILIGFIFGAASIGVGLLFSFFSELEFIEATFASIVTVFFSMLAFLAIKRVMEPKPLDASAAKKEEQKGYVSVHGIEAKKLEEIKDALEKKISLRQMQGQPAVKSMPADEKPAEETGEGEKNAAEEKNEQAEEWNAAEENEAVVEEVQPEEQQFEQDIIIEERQKDNGPGKTEKKESFPGKKPRETEEKPAEEPEPNPFEEAKAEKEDETGKKGEDEEITEIGAIDKELDEITEKEEKKLGKKPGKPEEGGKKEEADEDDETPSQVREDAGRIEVAGGEDESELEKMLKEKDEKIRKIKKAMEKGK
ncbi:MAG: hypothetical protein V1494_03065 [Candidatus Diapherotrites archaeon]